ncbi:HPr family phosphocarrier protein [Candidatus Xianfuyuplasma coldseepsis]|uniref:Phosphocarrier protein HPr n=1 Tax=Candidatus Xianfuyuplasma coldseepsis TaxID=2782163 RepID=A0A7L7KS89_9MOLU|nr:HPr family phosphocarrier protein [Xianfuyuplasma coldseepsis]QMS85603.1 HPr family phosphocarrier protein [Xianfuyuplasma coldseepsis]
MHRDFIITNEQGIHARPATNLVQKANQFKSTISLTFNGVTTDLKSIMGVLSLGVTRGSLVSIHITGEDELEAMQEITKLINTINM